MVETKLIEEPEKSVTPKGSNFVPKPPDGYITIAEIAVNFPSFAVDAEETPKKKVMVYLNQDVPLKAKIKSKNGEIGEIPCRVPHPMNIGDLIFLIGEPRLRLDLDEQLDDSGFSYDKWRQAKAVIIENCFRNRLYRDGRKEFPDSKAPYYGHPDLAGVQEANDEYGFWDKIPDFRVLAASEMTESWKPKLTIEKRTESAMTECGFLLNRKDYTREEVIAVTNNIKMDAYVYGIESMLEGDPKYSHAFVKSVMLKVSSTHNQK